MEPSSTPPTLRSSLPLLDGISARAPRGAPWALLGFLGATLAMVGFVGVSWAALVGTVVLQAVFLLFLFRHLVFVAASRNLANAGEPPAIHGEATPPVSVLVSCHNEAAVVAGLVLALKGLDYPAELLQVLLVDDGSTDATGELLEVLAPSTPQWMVLHRPPGAGGGKSGALNEALQWVTSGVVVVFDADHQPAGDVLRRLVRHFADPRVGAVQGRCVIRNPRNLLFTELIELDYLAGYLVNEYGRATVFGLPAYGGANCAVRTSSLRAVGGWNPHTVTEDTDLTLRLLLRGERVRYDVSAIDTEEGVTTVRRYWRQRYRWARGHQQVWRDYRRSVWSSPHLSLAEKSETTLFLLVFHVPVASAGGLLLLAGWLWGLEPEIPWAGQLWVFWTLLFLGPLLELSAGMVLGQVDRRRVWALLYFMPVFLLNIALCTKAWVDGLLGRPYVWVKTARAADPAARVSSPSSPAWIDARTST